MHFSDYDSDKSGTGNNLCFGEDGYYFKAKVALLKLSDKQIEIFRNDARYAEAKIKTSTGDIKVTINN